MNIIQEFGAQSLILTPGWGETGQSFMENTLQKAQVRWQERVEYNKTNT